MSMSKSNASFAGRRNAPAGGEGRHCREVRDSAVSLLRRFGSDEGGNILVVTGIALPLLLGAIGTAIAFSVANNTRSNMQTSLDSAVLAGVSVSDVESVQIATAQDFFQGNLKNFALASAKDINASFTVSGATLYGEASGSVANPFSGLIGTETIAANVKAVAIKKQIPICVLGLNGLDNGSFDINGSAAQFNADCAVQANSNAGYGMSMEGNPKATAKKFGVSGGHKGDGFSPNPTDGSPKVADPYASLPFPDYDDCSAGKGKKGDNIKDDTTLSPGTYCGGIHIFGNGTRVTLQPGIYVMVDGPFWVDSSSIVTGDQVMIAFTGKGAALQLWGNSSVSLTSPVSGTYTNMQFMQDWRDDNTKGLWSSVGGNGNNAKLQYDGVAYFPSENWWVYGNANVTANSPSLAIVADKIWTQGSASVTITNNNPRNLPVTVPKTTIGAVLIK